MSIQELSGLEKASMLLASLGASTSAQVFKHLSEQEIEKLSGGIVGIREVDPGLRESILVDFERSRSRTGALLDIVSAEDALPAPERPFGFLCRADAEQIAGVLTREPAQIAALVLVNLPPDVAADVLAEFGEGEQSRIASCICSMEHVEPEVVSAVEEALRAAFAAARKPVSTGLVPSLTFMFEDIAVLPDRSVRRLLREIDPESLRAALKGAETETREMALRNLPEGVDVNLDSMHPTKVREIEQAQEEIAGIARRLLLVGEIAFSKPREAVA
ncbi:MAG: FliG C-terminal domain-containing protein [Armatimonadota bacterium]